MHGKQPFCLGLGIGFAIPYKERLDELIQFFLHQPDSIEMHIRLNRVTSHSSAFTAHSLIDES